MKLTVSQKKLLEFTCYLGIIWVIAIIYLEIARPFLEFEGVLEIIMAQIFLASGIIAVTLPILILLNLMDFIKLINVNKHIKNLNPEKREAISQKTALIVSRYIPYVQLLVILDLGMFGMSALMIEQVVNAIVWVNVVTEISILSWMTVFAVCLFITAMAGSCVLDRAILRMKREEVAHLEQ